MKRLIINLLLIFFLGVLLYSGYQLYSIYSEYQKGRSEYKRTSEEVVTKKEEKKDQIHDSSFSQIPAPACKKTKSGIY